MARHRRREYSVVPGFGLTMGVALTYLGLLVLIPLSGLLLRTATLSWARVAGAVFDPRVLAAARLSLGAAFLAALANAAMGVLVAWVLVRYQFPGRRLVDAMIDLPFALPTAVAGIALTALYTQTGWIGGLLRPLGMRVAFTPLGVVVALMFVGLPFAVRTVQPVVQDLEAEVEEAAVSLGASRWQTFARVILPTVLPAVLTGFTLAFSRAIGEYGSVIFIAGNMPMRTEIVPLLIVTKLEQFDYAGATAIAAVLLLASFVLLLLINLLQRWSSVRTVGG